MNNLEEFWANNNSVDDFKEVGFRVKEEVIFLFQRSRSWPPTPLYWPCTWNTILFRWAKTLGPIPQRYLVICPFVFNKKIAPFSERPAIPEENQAYSTFLDSDRLHLMQMKRLEMIERMENFLSINHNVIIKFFFESLGFEGRLMWKWHPFPSY